MSRSILKNHVYMIENCSTKEELRSILIDVRNILSNNRSFSFFISKNKTVTDKISNIYLYNNSVKESVYRIINDIDIDIMCGCGNKCSFLDNNRGYNVFCSDRKCEYMNAKKTNSMFDTFISKYGHHPMKNESTKEKLKNSVFQKYGFDNIMSYYSRNNMIESPFKQECVKAKIKETFQIRYGGHPMQSDENFENNLKSRVKFKEFRMPSGKLIKVQGYEKYGIELLLNKYQDSDILSSVSDINREIGIINYFYLNKKRKYYPDFYIKSHNKIYEVKSIWTYKSNIEKNILKKAACENLGILFEFLIFDSNGKIIEPSSI